jgi:thioredoxin
MGVVAIGAQDFQQVVEKGGIVLIDWWAPWCGPCRAFAPTYEKVAEANPDVTFAKVNTEEERDLAGAFQIRSIPTLMIFRDKVLLFAQPGALPQEALEEVLKKARELDMEMVRAEIAKREAEQRPQQPEQG